MTRDLFDEWCGGEHVRLSLGHDGGCVDLVAGNSDGCSWSELTREQAERLRDALSEALRKMPDGIPSRT